MFYITSIILDPVLWQLAENESEGDKISKNEEGCGTILYFCLPIIEGDQLNYIDA